MSTLPDIYLFTGCDTPVCKTAYKIILSHIKPLSRLLSMHVPRLAGREINIVISDTKDIRNLNSQFRKVDRATDVLAFPMGEATLGEVWICPPVIRKNAELFDQPYKEELMRIAVHGILHLAGYDHTGSYTDESGKKERMFMLQEKIVDELFGK
jgi:probable rRNA maturation factor